MASLAPQALRGSMARVTPSATSVVGGVGGAVEVVVVVVGRVVEDVDGGVVVAGDGAGVAALVDG